jgi:casein kinase II subunit alpha
MYRHVKLHNSMIDHKTRQRWLTNLGLAEFCDPDQEYNKNVASRCFKDHLQNYVYTLDILMGCMLAGMMFQREFFFHVHDNYAQLVKIYDLSCLT